MSGERFAYIDQKIRHSLGELRANQTYDWDQSPSPDACDAAERLLAAESAYDQGEASETDVKSAYKEYVKHYTRNGEAK